MWSWPRGNNDIFEKKGPKKRGVRFDEVKTDANAARTSGTCSELNVDSDARVYIAF